MDELLIKDTFQRLYEEHKFMKECGLYNHEINKLVAEEFYRTGYNKSVDEFSEKLKAIVEKDLANPDLMLQCKQCGIWKVKDIEEIVIQMKI